MKLFYRPVVKFGSTRMALDHVYIPGSNPGGSSNILKGVGMLFILFSIAYSELIWYFVKSGYRPYKDMDTLLKFMVGLNYFLAIILGSKENFMFAVVCSLYQIVIFKFRLAEEEED